MYKPYTELSACTTIHVNMKLQCYCYYLYNFSACKYNKIIPDETFSLEAILIQNEVQNKVKQLLDMPAPLPLDQLPSSDISVSFEQGKSALSAAKVMGSHECHRHVWSQHRFDLIHSSATKNNKHCSGTILE